METPSAPSTPGRPSDPSNPFNPLVPGAPCGPAGPAGPAGPEEKLTAPLNATCPFTIENGVNNSPFGPPEDTLKESAVNAIELPVSSAPNLIPATLPSAFTSSVYCAFTLLVSALISALIDWVTPAVCSPNSAIKSVVELTVA